MPLADLPPPCPFRGWVAATHVSRYLRATGISDPNLWPKIDTSRFELMELFLSRSEVRPLEVYVPPPPKSRDVPPLFEALVPHLNRLESLSLQMSQKVYGMYHLLAEVDVSSLERLYISGAHGDPTGEYPIDWIPRLFVKNSQAPRLQHLCLNHIPLVSPFKFYYLSRLYFDDIPFPEIRFTRSAGDTVL